MVLSDMKNKQKLALWSKELERERVVGRIAMGPLEPRGGEGQRLAGTSAEDRI